jgi:ATP-binding cassette subfamily C protein LapB
MNEAVDQPAAKKGAAKKAANPKGVDGDWNILKLARDSEVTDPLLAALVFLTDYFGRPYSRNALSAGLPLEGGRVTPDLFVRAAARADLSARIAARSLAEIPDITLPAVLLLKQGEAVILLSVERSNAADEIPNPEKDDVTAQILLPESGEGMITLPMAALAEQYAGFVIFVKPAYKTRHEESVFSREKDTSWFWGTIKTFWPTYSQVAAAAFFVNSFALAMPLFVMNVYDRVVPNQAIETLWVLASGVGIIVLFDFVLKNIRSYFVDSAGKRADILLSSQIFSHILNMKFKGKPNSSGVFANQLRDFESLREFFSSTVLIALIDLPFILLFLLVIFMIGGPVVIPPALAVPVVLLTGYFMQRPFRRTAIRAAMEQSRKHGIILETIGALDTVKTLGAEGRMQREWERFIGNSAKTNLNLRTIANTNINIFAAVTQLVTVGVVIWGVYLIMDGALSFGGLIACVIIAGRVMAPLGRLTMLLTRLHQSLTALEELNAIMALPEEREPGRRYLARPEIKGGIEFKDVSFAYPSCEIKAVENISFKIRPNEKVGIIGATGSGKSTILRLIGNLYEPDDGAVYVDGCDLRQMEPADGRKAIGTLMQEVLLFDGTIRENIAMGVPHASDEMVLSAATTTGVHDFVSRLPSGYDWQVGERGQFLSGGQRQAIGLARAILREPPILCLDEPTSMMDVATEKRVMTQLARIMEGKTLILVTHRRSLMNLVDRVIVIDQGRILADGPRDKILAPRPSKLRGNLPSRAPNASDGENKGTKAPVGKREIKKEEKSKSGKRKTRQAKARKKKAAKKETAK